MPDFITDTQQELSAADAIRLVNQIDNYVQPGMKIASRNLLSNSGKTELYRGHHEYWSKRLDKAEDYYRKQFVELMVKIHGELPMQNASTRDKYINVGKPGNAAITMKNMLGKYTINGINGIELYKNALEEERHSLRYMDAVWQQSTKHYEGKKWAQRLVVFIGGPSASGKSFATESVIKKSAEFIPKIKDDNTGNVIVSVDGAIAREVSQMRKLVIQIACSKGYTGVRDLDKYSGILRAVKDNIEKAVLQTPEVSMVMPETFSMFFNPFSRIRDLIKRFVKLPKTYVMFSRVAANNSQFKDIVRFTGEIRAWKIDFSKQQQAAIDLNISKNQLPESKSYTGGPWGLGFNFGEWGTKAAETQYLKNSKDKLSLTVSHDLVVLKKNPRTSQWEPTKPGTFGAKLFSKRLYEHWQRSSAKRANQYLDLEEYVNTNPSALIIKSATEIEMARIKKTYRARIITAKRNMVVAASEGGDATQIIRLEIEKIEDILVQIAGIEKKRTRGEVYRDELNLLQNKLTSTSLHDTAQLVHLLSDVSEHARVASLFSSSTQSRLSHLKEILRARFNEYEGKFNQETNPNSPNSIQLARKKESVLQILSDLDELEMFGQRGASTIEHQHKIKELREKILSKISEMEANGDFHWFYSKTKRAMQNIINALQIASAEMILSEPSLIPIGATRSCTNDPELEVPDVTSALRKLHRQKQPTPKVQAINRGVDRDTTTHGGEIVRQESTRDKVEARSSRSTQCL